MEKKGIKETKEILEAVKEGFIVGKAIRDIVKDGIDASDLPKVFVLIKNESRKIDVFKEAIDNASLAKDELMDLDKEEIVALIMEVINGISEVEKA